MDGGGRHGGRDDAAGRPAATPAAAPVAADAADAAATAAGEAPADPPPAPSERVVLPPGVSAVTCASCGGHLAKADDLLSGVRWRRAAALRLVLFFVSSVRVSPIEGPYWDMGG